MFRNSESSFWIWSKRKFSFSGKLWLLWFERSAQILNVCFKKWFRHLSHGLWKGCIKVCFLPKISQLKIYPCPETHIIFFTLWSHVKPQFISEEGTVACMWRHNIVDRSPGRSLEEGEREKQILKGLQFIDPEVLIWSGFMKNVSQWERGGKTILRKSGEEMMLHKENAK